MNERLSESVSERVSSTASHREGSCQCLLIFCLRIMCKFMLAVKYVNINLNLCKFKL